MGKAVHLLLTLSRDQGDEKLLARDRKNILTNSHSTEKEAGEDELGGVLNKSMYAPFSHVDGRTADTWREHHMQPSPAY